MVMTCSLQNGIILLVMAFLISPYGLPMAAIWLLGKVQDLKFAISANFSTEISCIINTLFLEITVDFLE